MTLPTARDDLHRPLLADRYDTRVRLSPEVLYVLQDVARCAEAVRWKKAILYCTASRLPIHRREDGMFAAV